MFLLFCIIYFYLANQVYNDVFCSIYFLTEFNHSLDCYTVDNVVFLMFNHLYVPVHLKIYIVVFINFIKMKCTTDLEISMKAINT